MYYYDNYYNLKNDMLKKINENSKNIQILNDNFESLKKKLDLITSKII